MYKIVLNIGDLGEGTGRIKIKNQDKIKDQEPKKELKKIIFYRFGYSFGIISFTKFKYGFGIHLLKKKKDSEIVIGSDFGSIRVPVKI